MAKNNLKVNRSQSDENRTHVTDSIFNSVLFDIAFDDGFKKISEYLGEDEAEVAQSINLQTGLVLKTISQKVTTDTQTLISLVEFLKFIYLHDHKLAKVLPIRKYDRHADRGMEFLFVVCGESIGKEIDLLNTKSTLRADSNFTLVTIIASYILKRINLRLINHNFETYELFELLKNYSRPNQNAKNLPLALNSEPQDGVNIQHSKSWLILAFLVPLTILFLYLSSFLWDFNNRGQVSKVTFSELNSPHSNPLKTSPAISDKFIRIFTNAFGFLGLSENEDQELSKILSHRRELAAPSEINANNKIIGDSSEVLENSELVVDSGTSPVSAVKFGLDQDSPAKIKEKLPVDPVVSNQEQLDSKLIGIKDKKIFLNNELINDLSSFFLDSKRKKAVFMLGGVNFKFNQSEIDSHGKQVLDETSIYLNYNLKGPNYSISITGHTDNSGNEFANRKLSLERAIIAKNIFIANGIGKERITVWGAGSEFPLESNETPEGRNLNRRLTLEINK